MARRRKYNFKKKVKKRSQKKLKNPKKAMLNMRQVDSFRYELKNILAGMKDLESQGSVYGSIYSKASNIGIEEAEEFITRKNEEGVFDQELTGKLLDLISRYTRYR